MLDCILSHEIPVRQNASEFYPLQCAIDSKKMLGDRGYYSLFTCFMPGLVID